MRHTDHFVQLLRNGEQGPLIGISLGYGFVTQHETGFVEFEGGQLDTRCLRLYEFSDTIFLIYSPVHFVPMPFDQNPRDLEEKELVDLSGLNRRKIARRILDMPGVGCAWSYNGFIIGSNRENPEIVEFLKELYKAFSRGDGYVHLQELPVWNSAWSLCVCVQSIKGESIKRGGVLPGR